VITFKYAKTQQKAHEQAMPATLKVELGTNEKLTSVLVCNERPLQVSYSPPRG